jgi:catechol 2,3-dioxygenase-like lactoylglutathione lyase family enzyme
MKFKGINHLAMVTGDMEKTIRFWRDLIGMRLVSGFGKDGFRHYFFEIDEKNTIAFFEWDGAQPVTQKHHGVPVKGPIVFDHIAFGVDSSDELWEIKDKLQAAGFECSDVIDHTFIHSIYAFDPNGIPIEFCYDVKGYDIRKNPEIKDDHPIQAAQEGPEPQPGKWPGVVRPTPEEERFVSR